MTITDIRKNTAETIRVQVAEFKGSRYVDVRVHVESANGELVPTKKGITLGRSIIGDVITALEAANKSLE